MEEWKEYRLGDISSMKYGKLPPTSVGGNYPVWSGYRNVGTANTMNCSKGTMVVVARGVGGTGDVKIAKEDCYLTNLSIAVILDERICNPYFLHYKYLLNNLKYLDSGSAQSQITIDDLKRLTIKLPPLDYQNQIVAALKSFDDKIECNQLINDNLNQQAKTLFKSWFIDFEPFRDGEFVESELGMIPKGWMVETIEGLSEKMASGGTPKSLNKEYYSGDIKWFSTKELKDCFLFDSEKHISVEALDNSAAKMFPEGTVLMAIYAAPTVGRLGILSQEGSFNQAAVGIIPRKEIGKEFIYLTLLSERERLNNLASGAAQQNLNVGIVKQYRIVLPEQSILDKFNTVIKPLFEKICMVQQESRRLAQLRDTLLPRLMSGELNINTVNL